MAVIGASPWITFAIAVLLTWALIGCGSQSPHSPQAAATTNATASVLPGTGSVSPAAVGLKVFAKPEDAGVPCPSWLDRHAQLVLTSERNTYTSAELNRIMSFVRHQAPRPDDLLREVSGVLTSSTAPGSSIAATALRGQARTNQYWQRSITNFESRGPTYVEAGRKQCCVPAHRHVLGGRNVGLPARRWRRTRGVR